MDEQEIPKNIHDILIDYLLKTYTQVFTLTGYLKDENIIVITENQSSYKTGVFYSTHWLDKKIRDFGKPSLIAKEIL